MGGGEGGAGPREAVGRAGRCCVPAGPHVARAVAHVTGAREAPLRPLLGEGSSQNG